MLRCRRSSAVRRPCRIATGIRFRTGDATRGTIAKKTYKRLLVSVLQGTQIGSPGSPTTGRVARPLAEPVQRQLLLPPARIIVVDQNPPEWVDEPVPGYPKRPMPRDEDAAKALKKRTLTNLYNTRPQWLSMHTNTLDAAVAAAYGWSTDISGDEVLRELPALSTTSASGSTWTSSGTESPKPER